MLLFLLQGIPLIQSGSSAMNRQMTQPASPPPLPVADDDSSSLNDRSAVNDRYTDDLEAEFDDIIDDEHDENTVVMEMKI